MSFDPFAKMQLGGTESLERFSGLFVTVFLLFHYNSNQFTSGIQFSLSVKTISISQLSNYEAFY